MAMAYDALPQGRAFIAVDSQIDDARRTSTVGLPMSLNMLIECGDGFDYTAADFRSWCAAAGFGSFDVLALDAAFSAAIAYK